MSHGKPTSPETVARIRAAAAKDPELDHGELAERFGVSRTAVRNALEGEPLKGVA